MVCGQLGVPQVTAHEHRAIDLSVAQIGVPEVALLEAGLAELGACELHPSAVDPADVSLIAVSKRQPLAAVLAAADAGHLHFGENYAQEMAAKEAGSLGRSLHWHFIGRVQRNKAAAMVRAFRIHSLSEIRHAEALVRRADGRTVSALVSVNVAGEASKDGVPPSQLIERVRSLSRVPGLNLCGLMCMPPPSGDPEASAPYFEHTQSLLDQCRADGHAMFELSMGMPHDFHVAVRYGASWVRVGTAIFGPRPS